MSHIKSAWSRLNNNVYRGCPKRVATCLTDLHCYNMGRNCQLKFEIINMDKNHLISYSGGVSLPKILGYPCIMSKAVADGPVGQVLAGPLFLKVKTKFHFTESK